MRSPRAVAPGGGARPKAGVCGALALPELCVGGLEGAAPSRGGLGERGPRAGIWGRHTQEHAVRLGVQTFSQEGP